MDYVKIGRSGLEVSRLCLGCMGYAEPLGVRPWALGEEASQPFFRRAFEAGINFFDTSNHYSEGSSEEVLGRAVREFSRRDHVVIETKLFARMHPGPNGGGGSRLSIFKELDASL